MSTPWLQWVNRVKRWYRTGLDWDLFLQEVRQVIRPGMVLLDAGAGECKWAKHFPECQYIALDNKVGDTAWDYGQVQLEADLNERIPLADHSVDVIISIQVLEHLSSPHQAMREMARVLKPDGHLFMTTPFFYQEHQQPHDYFRYTRYGLQHLVEQAGLHPCRIQPMGGYFMLLRDQLAHFHHVRFFNRSGWLGRLLWLPRQGIKFWNLAIMPPILYALDQLDQDPIQTLGHVVHAKKLKQVETWVPATKSASRPQLETL